MNALRFAQKGAIESVLKLEQVSTPSLAAGEALVKVKAAGINGVRSACLSLRQSRFVLLLLASIVR
jgi:NADPH:quinone reductase-like Zn-dependent oxidoreductase